MLPAPICRFNPARSGNSSNMRRISLCLSVQPRSRGELTISGQFVFDKNGSTPLTRGTPIVKVVCRLASRLNPACAGNSCWRCPSSRFRPVQPRLRGELQARSNFNHRPQRFNPACAGNSNWRKRTVSRASGSTPLARGTQTAFLVF